MAMETRPLRILVTGSRDWTDRQAVEDAVLAEWRGRGEPTEVVVFEGACPQGGADAIARGVAAQYGFLVETHPARWQEHGKAAGPFRNQEMVDSGADVCLAFPGPDSRGTWDCVRRAERAGVPVRIVPAQ